MVEQLSQQQNEQLMQLSLKILQIKPERRSPNQVRLLLNFFQHLDFFKNLKEHNYQGIIEKLCKYLTFHFCTKNKYLFRFGDEGDKFYIILKGSVDVLVPVNVKKAKAIAHQINVYKNKKLQQQKQTYQTFVKRLQLKIKKQLESKSGYMFWFAKQFQNKEIQIFQNIKLQKGNQKSEALNKFQDLNIPLEKLKLSQYKPPGELIRSIYFKNNNDQGSNKNEQGASKNQSFESRNKLSNSNSEEDESYLLNCSQNYQSQSFSDNQYQQKDKKGQQLINMYPKKKKKIKKKYILQEDNDLRDRLPYQKVNTLKVGKSFGEQALHLTNQRSASVFCTQDCYFAVLDRDKYQAILFDYDQIRLDEILKFIQEIGIFGGWDQNRLFGINYMFRIVEVNKDNILFKESEVSEYFYFVVSGIFKVRFLYRDSFKLKFPIKKSQSLPRTFYLLFKPTKSKYLNIKDFLLQELMKLSMAFLITRLADVYSKENFTKQIGKNLALESPNQGHCQ